MKTKTTLVSRGRHVGWYLGSPIYENDPRFSELLESNIFTPASGFIRIREKIKSCSWCGKNLDDQVKHCSFCGGG